MNPEEFTSRIIKPAPLTPEEPIMEPEELEHPNTPVLENLLLTIDDKTTETNEILGHILVKLEDNSDETMDEHKLVKTQEIVDELKALKEVVKENNQWEVNLILE